ncbi:MAG: transposase [Alphaproteobacteria bacterium]|nr:transposase [Alphaproteobacteria bacterium]
MAQKPAESIIEMDELNKAVEAINFEVLDPALKVTFNLFLNKIEEQERLIKQLQLKNQQLQDENNRLKGEQGKPDIRPQTSSKDISSEAERKLPNQEKTKNSKAKNHKIKIDRIEKCKVDKSTLPADAVFKGCRSVIVQDLVIHTDNIQFEKEVYYSPSLKRTFMAEVPKGYEGEFGPGVKAFVLSSHYQSNMTESAIVATLKTHGTFISACTVSRILTEDKQAYHEEKKEIVKEGLAASPIKQMDDTSARVKGKNYFDHILCSSSFTAYFTRSHKDRLTLLEILSMGPLTFKFNDFAYDFMEKMELPEKFLSLLKEKDFEEVFNGQEMDALLETLFPDPTKQKKNRKTILEATAIAAYRDLPHALSIILTDEAPQFNEISEFIGSCWIHEGRHYKKLTPVFFWNQMQVDNFLKKFWGYYHELLEYKKSPNKRKANRLSKKFDVLFSEKTGYDELDKRIALSKSRKDSLLLVLKYPDLPLHNNTSELGARAQARKRDISLHTMSTKGTEAKDTFMTIVETAKKHSVNVYHYLYDRITKKYEMPSLATLIKEASNPDRAKAA